MARPLSTIPARDELSLLVDGKDFRGWTSLDATLSLDTLSTLEFSAPFESGNSAFRDTFRPFTFKPLELLLGGDLLFRGTLVDVSPEGASEISSVTVSGYSLPGVLVDCNIPQTSLPAEFKKVGLGLILKMISDPFGIETDVRGDTGATFAKVALDIEKKPWSLMSDLAKQRNMVLSNTPEGALLCWRSIATGNPVARFTDEQPSSKISAQFSAQEYFSEITGFVPKSRKRKGARHTEQNPWLNNVLRPKSFRIDDSNAGDADTAVKASLARMFANMASYTIEDIPTWRDPSGALFAPNTTATLTAPDVMVYNETELLIRHVRLHDEPDKRSCDLSLVLPGAFSGELPTTLPWSEIDGLQRF